MLVITKATMKTKEIQTKYLTGHISVLLTLILMADFTYIRLMGTEESINLIKGTGSSPRPIFFKNGYVNTHA